MGFAAFQQMPSARSWSSSEALCALAASSPLRMRFKTRRPFPLNLDQPREWIGRSYTPPHRSSEHSGAKDLSRLRCSRDRQVRSYGQEVLTRLLDPTLT